MKRCSQFSELAPSKTRGYRAYLRAKRANGTQFLYQTFKDFLDDLGPRPRGGRLAKLDKQGNFEPGNVCWTTKESRQQEKKKQKAEREAIRQATTIAGFGGTHGPLKKVYAIFRNAKDRCQNPHAKSYSYYGGRGVEFRFENFAQFYKEVGPRPEGHSLDRIDNNGHYEPGNVRWASAKVQANNKGPRIQTPTSTHFARQQASTLLSFVPLEELINELLKPDRLLEARLKWEAA